MKIALCGYSGKTGKEVYTLLKENNYDVIGIDKNSEPLHKVINNVDLVIDFTNKTQALKHIFVCLDCHVPFIVGTTGFTYDELALIKSLCNLEKVKGVICYNFSIPLNYLIKQIPIFSNYFESMEYIDIHHISKIDKVSGTTYLFMLKNNKIKVKSLKTSKNTITYVIQMSSKYDKMIISYQVSDKKAFAIGLLNYLMTNDDRGIVNLIK